MTNDELTKESYATLFEDIFDLTHHAIKVAQDQIKEGNEDLNVTALLKEIRKNTQLEKNLDTKK